MLTLAPKPPTIPAVTSLRNHPFDAFLVIWFALFAVSSLVFEPFIVFGVDLATSTSFVGRTWFWYASSFDPIFLDTPLWLRIMCGIDAFVPLLLLWRMRSTPAFRHRNASQVD